MDEKKEINKTEAEQNETQAVPEDASPEQEKPTPAEEPTAEEKLAVLNDQLLRALAEVENTRRRAERDRADALQYSITRFARDMLSVADNLERALAALPEDQRTDLPEHTAALLDGVDATKRDLLNIFARHKIIPIQAKGEKFDPNFHEAIFEAPNSGEAAGTIIDVMEIGYKIGDKLLRPARVGVAKD